MKKKIESLTAAQELKRQEYHRDWLAVGRGTSPSAELEASAERAIKRFYSLTDRAEPEVVWMDSPSACCRAIAPLRGKRPEDVVSESFWAQHDVGWLAFYLFGERELGVDYGAAQSEKLSLWADIARGCQQWWPYDRVVYIARQAIGLSLDAEGRLHNETGPALRYRDGYAEYARRGTIVPAEWILNPSAVDPALALTWPNIEQRRALAEILGWARVIEQLKPTVVDADPDPEIGTLLRVDLPGSPGEQFLRVQCGTKREFVLPVPPDVRTALAANAWTYNVDTKTLKQLEGRT